MPELQEVMEKSLSTIYIFPCPLVAFAYTSSTTECIRTIINLLGNSFLRTKEKAKIGCRGKNYQLTVKQIVFYGRLYF